MVDRLRDNGGRVFLYSEQLANRKGFHKFSTKDEEEFETVEAKPKRKKKVAKKAAPKPEPEVKPEAPEGLEDWE